MISKIFGAGCCSGTSVNEPKNIQNTEVILSNESSSIENNPDVRVSTVDIEKFESNNKLNSPNKYNRRRRGSISSESYTNIDATQLLSDDNDDNNSDDNIFKSPESVIKVKNVIDKSPLLSGLGNEQINRILNKMNKIKTNINDNIIIEGDNDSDNFYIVESGIFEVYKENNNIDTYDNQGCFGELSLMHGSSRQATVTSKTEGVLWKLNGQIFRKVVVLSRLQQTKKIYDILKDIQFFNKLTDNEMKQMSESLSLFRYHKNEYIIKENEINHTFYIILNGSVSVQKQNKNNQYIQINELKNKDYFGERSLILDTKTAASIKCLTDIVEVAGMNKESFHRLIKDETLNEMKIQIQNYKNIE